MMKIEEPLIEEKSRLESLLKLPDTLDLSNVINIVITNLVH